MPLYYIAVVNVRGIWRYSLFDKEFDGCLPSIIYYYCSHQIYPYNAFYSNTIALHLYRKKK
ncbi:MAG: hypothetical protein EBS29_11845 [Chloroflexia bacterium]|nr:hypothetical protein [Chloroflexia bacterium]